VLWEDGHLPGGELARFHTRSGLLTAERHGDQIELDFPTEPAEAITPPAGLAEALGVTLGYVGRNRMDYLIEVASEELVRGLEPDFAALKAIPTRGVIVTAPAASAEYDFVSRFFAPRAGIDEDPVTGSAHCCLGPFWQGRLGKNTLIGYQASARGGVVRVRVVPPRVRLGGQAITVLRGELLH
jgi:predicted PhzF superfamily epimerase YddE/YHI9